MKSIQSADITPTSSIRNSPRSSSDDDGSETAMEEHPNHNHNNAMRPSNDQPPTPILPSDHTTNLLQRIKKLTTMWADEEIMNGNKVFYWNILDNAAMATITARVPLSLTELKRLDVLKKDVIEEYGERLVKSLNAFVEQNRLQEYITGGRGDGLKRSEDGGAVEIEKAVVMELSSSQSSSSSSASSSSLSLSGADPSLLSSSPRKRKQRRPVGGAQPVVPAPRGQLHEDTNNNNNNNNNNDDDRSTEIARLSTTTANPPPPPPPQTDEDKQTQMTTACRTILRCIGENPNREGLLQTPERWAKALLYFTNGYHQTVASVTNDALFTAPPTSTPPHHHDDDGGGEIILVKDIEIHSLCEHHMVPFTGRIHIGYIPDATIIGLSKLARIAEVYARRLQVQERLTAQIADAVMEVVKPRGVAVMLECRHFCMVMRGVEKCGAGTATTAYRGCFRRGREARSEFMGLVGRRCVVL